MIAQARDRTPSAAQRVSVPARGLRLRRVHLHLALTASPLWPSACQERVGTRHTPDCRVLYSACTCPCQRCPPPVTARYARRGASVVGWIFSVRDLHPATRCRLFPVHPNAPGERRSTGYNGTHWGKSVCCGPSAPRVSQGGGLARPDPNLDWLCGEESMHDAT